MRPLVNCILISFAYSFASTKIKTSYSECYHTFFDLCALSQTSLQTYPPAYPPLTLAIGKVIKSFQVPSTVTALPGLRLYYIIRVNKTTLFLSSVTNSQCFFNASTITLQLLCVGLDCPHLRILLLFISLHNHQFWFESVLAQLRSVIYQSVPVFLSIKIFIPVKILYSIQFRKYLIK